MNGLKEHVLRFRAVNLDTFFDIKRGIKTVETRAATPRYRKIKVGDMLVFVCGRERFKKKVTKVKLFKSITALFKFYPWKTVMTRGKTRAEAVAKYHSFPGYDEKIKEFGLVAFEF